jgi:hypothetical protein
MRLLAWKVTGAGQYSVWNTDSNGNYIANAIGAVSGTSAALGFERRRRGRPPVSIRSRHYDMNDRPGLSLASK